jgi:hypothetical protein
VNTFEYLAVLFSIVIGLALTEMLQNIRGLLVARHRVTLFWPALLRAALLLLVLVQVWWSVFALRNFADWSFGAYAVVLLFVGLVYLAASLALPDPGEGEPVDLRAFYWADARPGNALLLAAVGTSVVKEVMIDGRLPVPVNLLFHIAFAAVTLVLLLFRNDRVHLAGMSVLLAAFITYVVALFDRLPA